MYNLNEVTNRKNTYSLKYDGIQQRFGFSYADLLPLWVADMDFKTPQPIRDALKEKLDQGVLGYSGGFEEVYESVIKWYRKKYNFEIDRSWINFSGTLVNVLNRLVQNFTEEGDEIIVQPPVFPAFFDAIKNHNRVVVENPLILKNGRYEMDLEDLKRKINPRVKMIILCSPHNPVGRVWSKKELISLTDILLENNILIVSDEAHSELVHTGYKHHFISTISQKVADNSILCVTTHKTFNMAGLEISNLIIPNANLRKTYETALLKDGINKPNLLGLTAVKAGFDHCEQWLDEVLLYIEGNLTYVQEFLNKYLPSINLIKPEGTFLAWLDLNALNLPPKTIENLLLERGKLLVNQGYTFGTGGGGFIRINVACPRSTLEEAMKRLYITFREEI